MVAIVNPVVPTHTWLESKKYKKIHAPEPNAVKVPINLLRIPATSERPLSKGLMTATNKKANDNKKEYTAVFLNAIPPISMIPSVLPVTF